MFTRHIKHKFTHLNTPPKYVPMLKNNNPKETSVTEDRRNVTFKLLSFTTHLDVVCWKVYDLRLNSFTKKKKKCKFLHLEQFPMFKCQWYFKWCKSAKFMPSGISGNIFRSHFTTKSNKKFVFLHILLCCMHTNEASFIKTINMFSAVTFLTQLSTFPTTNSHYHKAKSQWYII